MKKRNFSQWTFSFGAFGAFIGTAISQIGNFNLGTLLGGFSAALLVFIINIIYVVKKSDKTPEFDERTIRNMRNVYFYTSNIFTVLLIIILGILLAADVSSIPTITVLLTVFGYFALTGIIALIVSRR
ncbi:hypothetical protein [Oceanobacillus locisalsi]|uniref:DUF2178 domain-containing protein n=1 Tax=Oceanobacillus locisalsi TaxID=546107 RepID=A0ABW3NL57_9BACI